MIGQVMNQLIDQVIDQLIDQVMNQLIDHMRRDRAVEIANSTPMEVEENGTIREFQFGETEESKRAVAQPLREAYVQVVGRQLVVNTLHASISGQQLRTLERPGR